MKKIIILMFIILLSSFAYASTNYKINDIKCVGEMIIQINNISGDSNFRFTNCNIFLPNNYKCNCKNIIEVSNNFSNNNSINYTSLIIRMQYYIKALTGDEIIDQKNKRVETKTIYLASSDTSILSQLIKNNSTDIVSFIMWFIFIILLLGVFISIFVLVLFMNIKKIKRWLGMDTNKPMTFWEIVVSIFTRKNIERKKLALEKQQIKIKTIEETTSNNYDNEVRKLMKGL